MRPKLLRDFGWKVTFVLAKDWYEDRAAVLERLDRLLAGGEEPAVDEQEEGEEALADEVGDEGRPDASIELEAGPPVQPPTESEAAVGSQTPPPEASNTNQDSVAESAAPPQAAARRDFERLIRSKRTKGDRETS
jgi:hypothetical protein